MIYLHILQAACWLGIAVVAIFILWSSRGQKARSALNFKDPLPPSSSRMGSLPPSVFAHRVESELSDLRERVERLERKI